MLCRSRHRNDINKKLNGSKWSIYLCIEQIILKIISKVSSQEKKLICQNESENYQSKQYKFSKYYLWLELPHKLEFCPSDDFQKNSCGKKDLK